MFGLDNHLSISSSLILANAPLPFDSVIQPIVKNVKSNAIVVVKDKMLLGVGAGQMNRVTSARIALDWAGEKAKGAVIGSDAFFPMDDTVRLAAERGITAIAQPGGSVRDEDSINACNELGVAMYFTGNRHFYH